MMEKPFNAEKKWISEQWKKELTQMQDFVALNIQYDKEIKIKVVQIKEIHQIL